MLLPVLISNITKLNTTAADSSHNAMYKTPFHASDLSKSAFLVTGGAGFIGSNIVEYLVRFGAGKIRILDNLSTGFKANIEPFLSLTNVEFMQGDICNADTCNAACEGIDFISHQAALGSVPRSVANPLATHQVNVDGFLNMLIAARDAGVKRFVYASSSSVYGDSPIMPKKEAQIGNPLSPYAVSKLSDELYAGVFSLNYGMKIIGLRYFNVFGPRQNPAGAYAAAIPLFMDAMTSDKTTVIYGDGEQTRDFTFVENAVQANIRSVFAPEKSCGLVYNVATGMSVSVNDLYANLKTLLQSNLAPEYRPERKGEVKNSLADISLANYKLQYQPTVHLAEGLSETVKWFQEYKSSIKV